MKKITLLFAIIGLMLSSFSLTAQTYFKVSLNGSNAFVSSPGSFPGYAWGTPGVPGYNFNNTNSADISLAITDYDSTNPSVGPELFITLSRVGFGVSPLKWGSDNSTSLATLTPADFTDGAATISVSIPNGTLPVSQTADYVEGYHYILQVRGLNPSADQNYINFVLNVEEEIVLSTNKFKINELEASFYSADKDAIVIKNNTVSGNYTIFNVLGQSVLKGKIENEIKVDALKSGIYILSTDKGNLKFVK